MTKKMELNKSTKTDKKFIVVLADGKFHQTVDAGTEGATIRTYEDDAGVEQTRHELKFDEVIGKITEISFVKGKFDKNLQITIDDDGIVSMGITSLYTENLMKKLPSINFEESIKLVPYNFTPKGETYAKKGFTVYQDGLKVQSFYSKEEPEGSGKWVSINGIPEPEGDLKTMQKEDKELYNMLVRKFLIKEIEKLPKYVVREVKETNGVKEF